MEAAFGLALARPTAGPLIFVVYAVRIETEDGELVIDETRRRIFR